MHRRQLTILFPAVAILAAASLGAGCSTVENDAAARVNDTELTPDDLSDLVEVFGQPDPNTGEVDTTGGDGVRNAINTWVSVEALNAQFEADGIPLTQADLDTARAQLDEVLPEFTDQSTAIQDTLVRVVATSAALDATIDPRATILEATSNADIYVAPRFGQFDPAFGVLPLAIPPPADDAPVAAG